MLKIGFLVVVLAIGYMVWSNMSQPAQPFTAFNLPAKELRAYMSRSVSTDDHPCLNRSRCLVLYLSPWCPSCKNTKNFVPYIRQAMDNNSDTGFVVVVGKAWGNFTGGHEMARDIGGKVYIDAESQYWQQLRREVNAIPAWLVIEGNGDVSDTKTGSPPRHDVQTAKTFLASMSIK